MFGFALTKLGRREFEPTCNLRLAKCMTHKLTKQRPSETRRSDTQLLQTILPLDSIVIILKHRNAMMIKQVFTQSTGIEFVNLKPDDGARVVVAKPTKFLHGQVDPVDYTKYADQIVSKGKGVCRDHQLTELFNSVFPAFLSECHPPHTIPAPFWICSRDKLKITKHVSFSIDQLERFQGYLYLTTLPLVDNCHNMFRFFSVVLQCISVNLLSFGNKYDTMPGDAFLPVLQPSLATAAGDSGSKYIVDQLHEVYLFDYIHVMGTETNDKSMEKTSRKDFAMAVNMGVTPAYVKHLVSKRDGDNKKQEITPRGTLKVCDFACYAPGTGRKMHYVGTV